MTTKEQIRIAKRMTWSRTQDMDGAVCFTQNRIATPTVLLELIKTDKLMNTKSIHVEVPYTCTLNHLVKFLDFIPMYEMTEEEFYDYFSFEYDTDEIEKAWSEDLIDVEYFTGDSKGIFFVPVKGDSFDEELLFPLKNRYYGAIALPTMYPQREEVIPFGFPPDEPLKNGVQFMLDQGYISAMHYKLRKEDNC